MSCRAQTPVPVLRSPQAARGRLPETPVRSSDWLLGSPKAAGLPSHGADHRRHKRTSALPQSPAQVLSSHSCAPVALFSWEDSARVLKPQQGPVHQGQAGGPGSEDVRESLATAQISICQNRALVYTDKKGRSPAPPGGHLCPCSRVYFSRAARAHALPRSPAQLQEAPSNEPVWGGCPRAVRPVRK